MPYQDLQSNEPSPFDAPRLSDDAEVPPEATKSRSVQIWIVVGLIAAIAVALLGRY